MILQNQHLDPPAFEQALLVLNTVGAQGMSTDESKFEEVAVGNRRKALRRRRKPWLDPTITALWDALHTYEPHPQEHTAGPSRLIRHSEPESASRTEAVAQLPVNFYNPEWVRRASAATKKSLKPKDEMEIPVLVSLHASF